MKKLELDLKPCDGFFNVREYDKKVEQAYSKVHELFSGTGRGNEYTGWLNLPLETNKKQIKDIKATAGRLRENSDYIINIGIGGSYLGTKAVYDFISPKSEGPEILYAGNTISGTQMKDLMDKIRDKDVSLCVVSKSGTTTEPAIAFRILEGFIKERYGVKAKERIVGITDAKKGAVKVLCDEMGYDSFVIPDNIGGRYSVLTPVGLVPLAASGVDIDELVAGAADMASYSKNLPNDATMYAAMRNLLLDGGKTIEIMAVYEESLRFFTEWWKQLFGESEGKEGKGIFPASVIFSADLHSMGQYIQEGNRNIFETVINIKNPPFDMKIPDTGQDSDGLAYLAGKTMNYVNETAMLATINAHRKGGVPNILINLEDQSGYSIGQLIYFFEFSCAVSGYLLGVNPFDQPGVEAYKTEMFKMLGKPGF
ncbi:MAG: glucose-6-phosphate isomerase [Clostridia bacterium]|nr:glucose-6-phosphate isomerase [Clostridia bacterium]MBN2882332.1 glucose-6-phosphate isomerase [Clostridia bacterium]